MNRFLACLVMSAALMSAGGCVTKTLPLDAAAVWCATNSPQRPTQAEFNAMSDAGLEKAAAHNLFGEHNCGWKP
jgi:hypothetical protein